MKRFVIMLLMLCLMLAACGSPEASAPTQPSTEAPTEVQTEPPTERSTESPSAKVVQPLPFTLDLSNLDNCTVAVSLEKDDVWYGSGTTRIKNMEVTVYTYDLYDMVDIAQLQGGDTIVIRGQEVVIEALDRTVGGLILINGGLDMGGYDLWTNDNTVYFESGYSDMKYWQPLGTITLEPSADFVFTDASAPDQEPVTYAFEDLVREDSPVSFPLDPQSTTITIENGYVTAMERCYTP